MLFPQAATGTACNVCCLMKQSAHGINWHIVSWEPEGRYCRSKMFHWEPEGRYCHWLCTAIAPFWFSTEHLWAAIMPFWLSTDDTSTSVVSPDYRRWTGGRGGSYCHQQWVAPLFIVYNPACYASAYKLFLNKECYHSLNCISSVESQKGTINIRRCSVENQKGATTIDFVQL